MSLRHAVLGLLVAQPSTGYELTQKFDRSLAHAWHASHSQIYPELGRLDEAGLAEVVEEGARRSRTWAATDAGRQELRRWMTETPPIRSTRNETALRWFLVTLLDPEDQRRVYAAELEYVEEELLRMHELDEHARRLTGAGAPPAFVPNIALGLRLSTVMRDWLAEQLAALDA